MYLENFPLEEWQAVTFLGRAATDIGGVLSGSIHPRYLPMAVMSFPSSQSNCFERVRLYLHKFQIKYLMRFAHHLTKFEDIFSAEKFCVVFPIHLWN